MQDEAVIAGDSVPESIPTAPNQTNTVQPLERLGRREAFATALAFEGGLGVLALLLAWPLGVPLGDFCRPSWSHCAIGVAAVAPMLALFVGCLLVDIPAMQTIRRFLDQSLPWLLGNCTSRDLLLISAAAGIGEELFFRGMLQWTISSWLGGMFGLVATSLLFGLAHCITSAYALLTFVIGLYLGWLTIATNSLIPPIIAHGLYDWIALVYLLKMRQRSNQ